jgi:hypothetical protein
VLETVDGEAGIDEVCERLEKIIGEAASRDGHL